MSSLFSDVADCIAIGSLGEVSNIESIFGSCPVSSKFAGSLFLSDFDRRSYILPAEGSFTRELGSQFLDIRSLNSEVFSGRRRSTWDCIVCLERMFSKVTFLSETDKILYGPLVGFFKIELVPAVLGVLSTTNTIWFG